MIFDHFPHFSINKIQFFTTKPFTTIITTNIYLNPFLQISQIILTNEADKQQQYRTKISIYKIANMRMKGKPTVKWMDGRSQYFLLHNKNNKQSRECVCVCVDMWKSCHNSIFVFFVLVPFSVCLVHCGKLVNSENDWMHENYSISIFHIVWKLNDVDVKKNKRYYNLTFILMDMLSFWDFY